MMRSSPINRFYSSSCIVLLALIILLASPGRAAAGNLKLVRGQNETELTVFTLDAGGFLDLGELAFALGGELVWREPGAEITWRLGRVEFEFDDMMAFFRASGDSYQLVAASRLQSGRFLVPLQLALEYLPRLLPGRFEYEKHGGRLIDSGVSAPQRRSQQPVATPDGQSYRIRTVVIDPGHGGKDPGTIARKYKLHEKHIVLDIAKKVVQNLNDKTNLNILLIRDSDRYIHASDRGPVANKKNGDLFVSIHVNASTSRSTNGSKTFFLSEAKTNEDRATEMLENEALKYESEGKTSQDKAEISLILQDMAQNEYLRESQDLSMFIQRELADINGLKDLGLGQANFAVLRRSYMPAALVETAFISNQQDEQKLNTPAFRNKLAGAITKGIIKYVEQYHRKLANGS